MVFHRRMAGRLTSVVAAVVAALAVAASPAPAAPAEESLQTLIDAELAAYPGGVQVSDNAVAYHYNDGVMVTVFPSPGEESAPAGLGTDVRLAEADQFDLIGTAVTGDDISVMDVNGCPTGVRARWYCFYDNDGWGGKRWQFKDTTIGDAGNWGFNDRTNSWVNTNPHKACSTFKDTGLAGFLWYMPGGVSKVSNVGTAARDRLTSWECWAI